MFKLNKPPRAQLKVQFGVFLWIAFLNVLVQIFQEQLNEMHFYSWAFFMVNIMFFLIIDPHIKERYLQVLFGSIFGIILAALMVISVVCLEKIGLPYIISVSIPVVICLALLIMCKPILPVFFNNYGFAYFMLALITPKQAVANMPYYLICTILGHIIATGGSLLIMLKLSRRYGLLPGQSKTQPKTADDQNSSEVEIIET